MAQPTKLKQKSRARGVRVGDGTEIQFCDPSYELHLPEESFLGETGHLVVFEIRNKIETLVFQGRWDDAQMTIDIDLAGKASKGEKSKFRKSQFGSSGHHPVKVEVNQWKYQVDIEYRGRKIFAGLIRLHVNHLAVMRAEGAGGAFVSFTTS